MNLISYQNLSTYWSTANLEANAIIILHILGSFFLGLIVGYERSYRGRAAGMRTYGLVCMAATALTVIAGYPAFWYGGQAVLGTPDPTRVIQGIVTGVGFLGAGVIMKEGFNISGLTTAASIWASSVIGILVGVGFYAAAFTMAVLSAVGLSLVFHLESALPQRAVIAVLMRFKHGYRPKEDVLIRLAKERGYLVQAGTLAIKYEDGVPEWRFNAESFDKRSSVPVAALAAELATFEGVSHFSVTNSRN